MTVQIRELTMNDKRKVLGKGLESLLPARPGTAPQAAAQAAPQGELVREIPLVEIDRSPWQTRDMPSPESVQDLAASIRTAGVVQPIVVRQMPGGRYQLIAGERRIAASFLVERSTVPAIVRQVSNELAAEMTLIENLLREDLNPMEQAWAFEKLASEFALTQEQIAERTGKDRASIGNYLRLLKAPEEMQKALSRGELTIGHAKALMALSPGLQVYATKKVLAASMSVRQTERYVQSLLLPKPQPQQQEREVDPNVRAAEQQLERSLGCKVKIEDKSGKGKIVIEYGSLEDFDRVLEALSK